MKLSDFTGGMFAAKVVLYSGKNKKGEDILPNKHGVMPVVLVVLAGKCPINRVIDGTSAERMGIELNTSYLFSVSLGKIDEEYGQEYNYTPSNELKSALETLEICNALGAPEILE